MNVGYQSITKGLPEMYGRYNSSGPKVLNYIYSVSYIRHRPKPDGEPMAVL